MISSSGKQAYHRLGFPRAYTIILSIGGRFMSQRGKGSLFLTYCLWALHCTALPCLSSEPGSHAAKLFLQSTPGLGRHRDRQIPHDDFHTQPRTESIWISPHKNNEVHLVVPASGCRHRHRGRLLCITLDTNPLRVGGRLDKDQLARYYTLCQLADYD